MLYESIISKLDNFIKKYYKNEIVKGIILSSIILITISFTYIVSEFYSHFSRDIRIVLFYTIILLFSIIIAYYIIRPVFALLKIGKHLSRKDAAKILSNHFDEVKDKLLNVIELKESKDSLYSEDLIIAAIEQKIETLKPVPFTKAIDFRKSKKLLPYLALILVVVSAVSSYKPEIIKKGGERVIKPNEDFPVESPYELILENEILDVERGKNLQIRVLAIGDIVPVEVKINFGTSSFKMKRDKNLFIYDIKSINNSLSFNLSTDILKTESFRINLLESPKITKFSIASYPPEYTKTESKIYENIGDITVPEGTKLNFDFITQDVSVFSIDFQNDTVNLIGENEIYTYERTAKSSRVYSISIANKDIINPDYLSYRLTVVEDVYPTISVQRAIDSVLFSVAYFKGLIKDDYGFSELSFVVEKENTIDTVVSIPFRKNDANQEWFFSFDFQDIKNLSEEEFEYYFIVKDNDEVNGYKSASSRKFQFYIPSKEEVKDLSEKSNEAIYDKLEENLKIAKEMQEKLNQLKEKSFNDELSDWEKSQMLEDILQKHEELEKNLEEVKDENAQKNQMIENLEDFEESLMQKQNEIQELLEEIMTDELRELMEELEKLKDEINESELNELTEDIDMSYEELEEQLDRELEMLKKLEIEQKLENLSEDLEELSRDQEELSEEIDKEKLDEEKLGKQKKQKEKFGNLKEEYEELLEKNKELKEKMPLDDFDSEMNSIQENFKQTEENMEKGKSGKSSKGAQQNSQKLQELSKSMMQMMQQMAQQQQAENMENLRQIMENLVIFSFDQEELISLTNSTDTKSPMYNKIVFQQKKLSDDFIIIEDSLSALANRTPQISSAIEKETTEIKKRILKSLDNLEDVKKSNAAKNQQYTMTSANNLALLLDEVMQQMQDQMSQQMQGEQNCQKNQGNSQPNMSQMKSMQQSMKSQLEQMIEEMRDRKSKGKKGSKGESKKIARMMAQQEIFKKMLGEMGENSDFRSQTKEKLTEVEQLIEQNENDLINKNITPELLERQELILTRLLEAEKSENEREIEKKRKSEKVKERKYSNPKEIFEYKDSNLKFEELLDNSNIELRNYFNKKYKEYLFNLKED